MIWFLLFGLAAVLALRKAAEKAAPALPPIAQGPSPVAARHPPPMKPTPKIAGEIGAEVAALDWTDPAAIMDLARKAQAAGAIETAKALASTAQDTTDVKKALETAGTGPVKSPLPDVTDVQWTAFVRLYRGGNPKEISPAYCLGLFNIGFLRLRELGLAEEVKQGTHDGRTVWMGKLKPPMTLTAFLDSPVTQYKVFAKDMRERAAFIREKYGKVIGTELPGLPGIKVSLSGLLGVIKLSGTKGFAGWISEEKQREKFKHTTAAFKAANGIF